MAWGRWGTGYTEGKGGTYGTWDGWYWKLQFPQRRTELHTGKSNPLAASSPGDGERPSLGSAARTLGNAVPPLRPKLGVHLPSWVLF